MKKSFFIVGLVALSLMLIISESVKAHDASVDPRSIFTFGVKAGLNYSDAWDKIGQDFKTNSRAGFAGGVFFVIPIGKVLGLQPEVLISQKGFQGSGTLLGFPYSFSKTTTYMDIPVQLALKPVRFITIIAGPQYSYLLHEKNIFTFIKNSAVLEQEFKNDNIRKNIMGFVFGADLLISHIVFSGRLGWDMQKNNGDGTSSTPRYKNKWMQLTVGFKI